MAALSSADSHSLCSMQPPDGYAFKEVGFQYPEVSLAMNVLYNLLMDGMYAGQETG